LSSYLACGFRRPLDWAREQRGDATPSKITSKRPGLGATCRGEMYSGHPSQQTQANLVSLTMPNEKDYRHVGSTEPRFENCRRIARRHRSSRF
jgi:hypothetical protein